MTKLAPYASFRGDPTMIANKYIYEKIKRRRQAQPGKKLLSHLRVDVSNS